MSGLFAELIERSKTRGIGSVPMRVAPPLVPRLRQVQRELLVLILVVVIVEIQCLEGFVQP